MKLASLKTIKKRLASRNIKSYSQPKDYLKNNISAPKRLKHNAGNGGEYARSYMSDYAISY